MQFEQWLMKFFKVNSVSEFVYGVLLPAALCFYIGYSAQLNMGALSSMKAQMNADERLPASVGTQEFPREVVDTTRILSAREEIEDIKKILKDYPEDADLYNNLATQYLQNKKYRTAEKYYKKALQINERHSEATFNLAVMYEKQRRWKYSKRMYEKYLQENKGSQYASSVRERIRILNSVVAGTEQRRSW